MENRLVAEVVGDMTRCCICLMLTKNIHWHHTIPQSCGGVDSLQIPLDGNCHTVLHAKASAIVSRLNGNRKDPVLNYWQDPASELRADPWLRILVDALMNPPLTAGAKEILLPMIKVDEETRFQLDLLKKDLAGVTNLSQVLHYCIAYTLKNKGLRNDSEIKRTTNKRTGKKRANLW